MTERLTKARAIELFRQQWSDMRDRIGENPKPWERDVFKLMWIDEHFPGENVNSGCFLCEYDMQQEGGGYCDFCPIEWPEGHCMPYNGATNCYISPISEILALPERKETEDDTNQTV